jgi:uncharacterized membrane protein YedE/YeeE
MRRNLAALIAGLVFGLGLTISQMVNPAKILAFLDISGNWDPSLILVMIMAVIVTFVGYRLVWTRPKPMFDQNFELPTNREIDTRLIAGASMFGAGWGLVGFCPGPAISALTLGGVPVFVFVAAMIVGMGLFEWLNNARATNTPSPT